jgi:hypothetical protein
MSLQSIQFDYALSIEVVERIALSQEYTNSLIPKLPIALSAQCDGGFAGGYGRRRRRYTRAEQIEKLAVDKYKKNGQGLTFNDLLHAGLTSNKKQSQISLKHYPNNGILFTISAHKPQQ